MKKKILYFLALWNTLTLPVIGILFVVFLLQDIPLKYLIGFIVVYAITKTLSLIFDTEKTEAARPVGVEPPRHHPVFLVLANIALLGLLALLIGRYQLDTYRWYIMGAALLVINGVFFEVFGGYISTFFRTAVGTWIVRTLSLLLFAGVVIALWNSFMSSPAPSVPSTPRQTSSEVTGTISTIDMSVPPEEVSVINGPLDIITHSLSIGGTGSDISDLQSYLRDTGYYTGVISGTYDTETAASLVRYMRENPLNPTGTTAGNEVTGTLSTDSGVTIDSIESVDGGATARIENGQIIVEVLPVTSVPSETAGWQIQSSIKSIGGGGLQGVVISAPVSTPRAGTYDTYQSITLSAEGASGIFFTIDGSEPNCLGKGKSSLETTEKTFTLKAISCFGGNRIRGPIATYKFSVK